MHGTRVQTPVCATRGQHPRPSFVDDLVKAGNLFLGTDEGILGLLEVRVECLC